MLAAKREQSVFIDVLRPSINRSSTCRCGTVTVRRGCRLPRRWRDAEGIAGDLSSRGLIVDGNADDGDKEKKRTSGGSERFPRKERETMWVRKISPLSLFLSFFLSFSSSFPLFRWKRRIRVEGSERRRHVGGKARGNRRRQRREIALHARLKVDGGYCGRVPTSPSVPGDSRTRLPRLVHDPRGKNSRATMEEAEDNNPADSRLIVAAYFDPPMGPEPLRETRFLRLPASSLRCTRCHRCIVISGFNAINAYPTRYQCGRACRLKRPERKCSSRSSYAPRQRKDYSLDAIINLQ